MQRWAGSAVMVASVLVAFVTALGAGPAIADWLLVRRFRRELDRGASGIVRSKS
jgi:hypothetical protein